jgi:hypothetical protein
MMPWIRPRGSSLRSGDNTMQQDSAARPDLALGGAIRAASGGNGTARQQNGLKSDFCVAYERRNLFIYNSLDGWPSGLRHRS